MHWCRVVMNERTDHLVRQISPKPKSVLEISGQRWEGFGFDEYTRVNFPEYDICDEVLETTYDLIVAEQVFEHLLWPYRAGRNIWEMLNPGGHFLITTPFLIRLHDAPYDCTRWSDIGLKHFLMECGFSSESVQAGSWGNRACVKANFRRWTTYRRWIHSLKNERDFPLVVWALARRA
jgi:SAM-dependent methyltransferase